MKMRKRRWNPAVAGLLLAVLAPGAVDAHSEFIAPIERMEKIYRVGEPLGRIELHYSSGAEDRPATLKLKTGLFEVAVPSEGLADLPRPQWERLRVLYSMISLDLSDPRKIKWVDRPYVYVRVPLRGPIGETWQRTWTDFHFDHDGKLTRRLSRHDPLRHGRTYRLDWPIGSERSAEELLKEAQEEEPLANAFQLTIVPEKRDGTASIRWGEGNTRSFSILLKNLTDEPQPVFEPHNSWGYRTIEFNVALPSGESFVVRRKPQVFTRNIPSTFLVPPKGYYIIPITFNEQWEGTPDFGESGRTRIRFRAIYHVAPTPESEELRVWTGKIASEIMDVEVNHW